MIELSDNPWRVFERLKAQWQPTNLDILTGFIGAGASQALAALGVSARIIMGLPVKSPSLSKAQRDELCKLLRTHQVRSIPGLHAKMYVFDQIGVVLGSANFTRSGFEQLDEIVVFTNDRSILRTAKREFEKRWIKATPILIEQISVTISESDESALDRTLGTLDSCRQSGFSSSNESLKPVRLCAYWPKWLEELNRETTVDWSTSPRARIGDLQLFAITKLNDKTTANGEQKGVDAIHSLWRAASKFRRRKSSRWPVGADFQLVLRLERPVPKKALIESGILRGGRWPRTPNGKVYRDWELCELIKIIKAFNPKQRSDIDSAFRD
jgi:hypothetical protein